MTTFINREGIRYRQTTVEIREDLHRICKENKWNMSAMINKEIERRIAEDEA